MICRLIPRLSAWDSNWQWMVFSTHLICPHCSVAQQELQVPSNWLSTLATGEIFQQIPCINSERLQWHDSNSVHSVTQCDGFAQWTSNWITATIQVFQMCPAGLVSQHTILFPP